MSKTTFSIYVYGLYLTLSAGLPLIVSPEIALGILNVTVADPTWVRMFGALTMVMGGFYILSVHYDMEALYIWTVPARYLMALFAIAMILFGKIGLGYFVPVVIDVVSASLTWLAIRHESPRPAAEDHSP